MKHPITGSQLSGHGYIKARLREELGWFPLIVRPKEKCYCTTRDDSITSTVCRDCVASWCIDFVLVFYSTAAGRAMAEQLGLDPWTACEELRKR